MATYSYNPEPESEADLLRRAENKLRGVGCPDCGRETDMFICGCKVRKFSAELSKAAESMRDHGLRISWTIEGVEHHTT